MLHFRFSPKKFFAPERVVYRETKLSSAEEQHYKLAVEESAQKIARVEAGKATEVNDLIEQLYAAEYRDDELRERFMRDVIKRAAELHAKIKNDRERTIVDEFEGKISIEKGAGPKGEDVMRQVGVEKKFSFRVRGKWWDLLGVKVTQEQLNAWLDEAKQAEQEIAKHKVELAMYKAARQSMKRAKTILKVLKKAVENTSTDVLKASVKNYMDNREKSAQLSKAITAEEKELAKKKERLELALKKIEEKRQHGRELFDKAFKPQLQVLLVHKKEMAQADFDAKLIELRNQVKAFGNSVDIVHMEFFLNEALGIKPLIYENDPVYAQPQTEKEKARELARAGKWWRTVFETPASDGDINRFTDQLRKINPSFLTEIVERELDTKVAYVLRFLYRGKLSGKIVLPLRRLAKLDPVNVAEKIKLAAGVAADADWEDRAKTFSDNWKDYSIDEFDYAYNLIKKGVTVPSGAPAAKAAPVERPIDEVKVAIKDVFNLSSIAANPTDADAIADHLYNTVMQGNAEYQLMLQDDNTKRKLKFFVTYQLGTLDLRAKVTPPKISGVDEAKTILGELLKNIPLFHKLDETAFANAANDYFTKEKQATYPGFIKYLKTEYGGA